MNMRETAELLAVIGNAYPALNRDRDPAANVRYWQTLFADDPAAEVNAAFLAWAAADEKGFPPTPGMLRAKLATLRNPQGDQSEQEAWALVRRALRNSLYGYEREYAALPETIRLVLGEARILQDWAMMDAETVDSVVASNFMRSYRARAVHVKELQALPAQAREVFGAVAEALRLPEDYRRDSLPAPERGEPEAPINPDGWKLARERIQNARKLTQEGAQP